MKSLRKSILTLLALTLFGGAGAWAQGPTAAEINSDLYSGWTSDDGTLFKASELPGFQAVTEDQAKILYSNYTKLRADKRGEESGEVEMYIYTPDTIFFVTKDGVTTDVQEAVEIKPATETTK